ncbi:MAG: phosphonate ABC transporter, permease protein PhnE [Desulforhopalus sp.]|jgi:phosphonate transport system permease protein|nr:phosphonate ABC transporter, permease protein PhnE [Desulforhopalus sp.]
MNAATITADLSPASSTLAWRAIRRNSLISIAGTLLVLLYLLVVFSSFNLAGLIAGAQPQRATLLATDAFAHKVHVTKNLRGAGDDLSIAIEGERTATYQTPPEWIEQSDEGAQIALGKGYHVEIDHRLVRMVVPDYGTIEVEVTDGEVITRLPEGLAAPDWLQASAAKFDARPTLSRRVQVSKARIEVHRYFPGWENFFFPFRSALTGYSFSELFALAMSEQRLQPDIPNWKLIFNTFWTNPDWQHGHVFTALLETLLMAVLGTLTAALVGLPLAVLAASNFTPSQTLRFAVRRLFDFLRGIDFLIWSLIFIRAFGLGPLTGALAIAFTDTGSLGKLFSEALENVDNKQMEGVRSTGANRWQFYRFGVIPQIIPIFVSQGLYYLESNVRSATIIGALGAGGIGLLLVETMNTQRDWENVLYLILLTIGLVMIMDSISTRLRRRLIQGSEAIKQAS